MNARLILRPKNWESFQHYKDRAPAWIKLHRSLLDDYEFNSLPVASQALAPKLWLLASESEDGRLQTSLEELAFRLRTSQHDLVEALAALIIAGFFLLEHDASGLLASRYQAATSQITMPAGRDGVNGASAIKSTPYQPASKTLAQPEQPASTLLAQSKRRVREETEEEKDYCAALPSSPTPFITLPLVGCKCQPEKREPESCKQHHCVTEPEASRYQGLYPAVDVKQELREILAWLDANRMRRKTRGGIGNMIVHWLGKEQDKGGRHLPPEPKANSKPGPDPFDLRTKSDDDLKFIVANWRRNGKGEPTAVIEELARRSHEAQA